MDNPRFDILEQYDYHDDEHIVKFGKVYANEIGVFMVYFSFLEDNLNIAIAEGLHHGTHEIGYLVIQGLSMKNKIDLFSRLYFQIASLSGKKKNIKLFKFIKSHLESANAFRNALVHANWSSLTKDKYVRTKIMTGDDGFVTFKSIKITPQIIRSKTVELQKLNYSLGDFPDTILSF